MVLDEHSRYFCYKVIFSILKTFVQKIKNKKLQLFFKIFFSTLYSVIQTHNITVIGYTRFIKLIYYIRQVWSIKAIYQVSTCIMLLRVQRVLASEDTETAEVTKVIDTRCTQLTYNHCLRFGFIAVSCPIASFCRVNVQ